MASSMAALSEDQFLCPICLDVFNQPVSTPCGHNFCMPCISAFWSTQQACRCPVCKHLYPQKPHLKVNTFISELASRFTSPQLTGGGRVVSCDVCADSKQKAVKSCLECQTSYCDLHLEPHYRASGLKRHTLVEPVAGLEDRICREHNRLLVSFCTDHNAVVCDVCASSGHAQHKVVPMQQAHATMRPRLAGTECRVQEEIQKRVEAIQRVKESLGQIRADTKGAVANSERELAALVIEIQKNRDELVRLTEEKQKANEEQAEGFIRDAEREVAALQKTAADLRELSETEDSLVFLQAYSKVAVPPQAVDLSTFSLKRRPEIQQMHKSVGKSVSQIRVLLDHMRADIKKYSTGALASTGDILRLAQQFEVDVVLDPDIAHPQLVLSRNLRQVRFSDDVNRSLQNVRNTNPKMFSEDLGVLGQKGFSCKFYFEVLVSGKTEFCLGVAMASILSTQSQTFSQDLWAIWFKKGHFEAYSRPRVPVYRKKAERIGVYVDYEGDEVSFFDVKAAAPIHSFRDCNFTQKLYPYFNPCDNEYGSNWDPMIVVPVGREHQAGNARNPPSLKMRP